MDQRHEITWRDDGVPVSLQFDDPFYSLDDGLAETRHVFLGGNDLPHRFRPGFHVAELGFGTGLNLAATLLEWARSGTHGPLRFTSFEAYPISGDAARHALMTFPETAPFGDLIATALEGEGHIESDLCEGRIVFGDARVTVPEWPAAADAWFLDGFSAAKNPELWEPALMQAVAAHTNPGGTCATYSAAGRVRRALTEAGFVVARTPGFGRKRHMCTGRLP